MLTMTLMVGAALLAGCGDKDGGAVDSAGGDGGDGGAQAAPLRPAEPAPWAAPGSADLEMFPAGALAGDPLADSVVLSTRTGLPQATLVVVGDDGAGGWTEVHRQLVTAEADAISLRTVVEGLQPDTVHNYAFFQDDPDAGGARSPVGRFRTGLDDAGWRQLTLGATSCLGGNLPWPNMSAVASRDLDGFLFLGDMVYAAASSLDEYRADWDAVMVEQGMVDVGLGTGTITTWDDHEVANNWSQETIGEDRYQAALQAFRESMPQRQGPEGGIWRQVSWGAVLDVFVLDCRSERIPDQGQYISQAQMDWLKAGLSDSDAAFKLILNSVPITDLDDFYGFAAEDDRWQGFPEQREEILSYIDDMQIEGVLWMAGDVHHGMVATVGIPGSDGPGLDQWEVAVGPAGSTPNIAADLYEHDGSHYKLLFSTWSSTVLTLDPGLGTVNVEYVGDDGVTFAEILLTP